MGEGVGASHTSTDYVACRLHMLAYKCCLSASLIDKTINLLRLSGVCLFDVQG